MSESDSGGPVFSVKKDLGLYLGITEPDMFAGLTKREWYAGMALQGMIASGDANDNPVGVIAQEAYKLADSMIRAGKGENNNG